jgi:hypothetical protein
MKKVIRLSESQLIRAIERIVEQTSMVSTDRFIEVDDSGDYININFLPNELKEILEQDGLTMVNVEIIDSSLPNSEQEVGNEYVYQVVIYLAKNTISDNLHKEEALESNLHKLVLSQIGRDIVSTYEIEVSVTLSKEMLTIILNGNDLDVTVS